jgi:hypothetical protein
MVICIKKVTFQDICSVDPLWKCTTRPSVTAECPLCLTTSRMHGTFLVVLSRLLSLAEAYVWFRVLWSVNDRILFHDFSTGMTVWRLRLQDGGAIGARPKIYMWLSGLVLAPPAICNLSPYPYCMALAC